VVAGVGGVDDRALRRDGADQPLAYPHPREVDGLLRQPLGGEQLEHVAGAVEVDGADLGHEVRRDDRDDPVEPLLRRHRLGHDVDQPPEQAARAGELRPHLGRRLRATRPPPAGIAATRPRRRPGGDARAAAALEPRQGRLRLPDQLGQDLGRGPDRLDEADALPGHQRAVLDVALDHGPAQRPAQ
jgi:hypothetical protein